MGELNVRVGSGVIILNQNNEVLLGHRCKKKADTGGIVGRDTWSLPGGKQEFDETILECIIREAKEECGLDIFNPQLLQVFDDMEPDRHFLTVLFITREFSGEPKVMEIDKEDDWRWFNINSLPENLYEPSRKCLEFYKSVFSNNGRKRKRKEI